MLAPPVVLPTLAQNSAPVCTPPLTLLHSPPSRLTRRAVAMPPDASGMEKDRREELLPFGPELLSAILLGVSHEAADIQFVASKANAAFLELLRDTQYGSVR